MEKYKVRRDDDCNLTFSGEVIAKVETSPNNASSDYSGAVGQWTELTLFKTASGKYVCSRVERTQWQDGRDSHEAGVATTESDVMRFFGFDDLAKELYEAAEIDAYEKVE